MKERWTWHSPRLDMEIGVARYGHFGQPVLLYPTAGGDCEESERFLLLRVLAPLLEAGRIKVYACDSVAGQVWTDDHSSGAHRAWFQGRFDAFVRHELVPHIRRDCDNPDIEIFTAGASVGAFNALASICRHPDVFSLAVCMSGTFDLTRWMAGDHTIDFHYASPLHFLPGLGNESAQLQRLRQRFIILATGEGRWESPAESWQVAHTLGSLGIPNRVDLWGAHRDHNWETWRVMLPMYLDDLTR